MNPYESPQTKSTSGKRQHRLPVFVWLVLALASMLAAGAAASVVAAKLLFTQLGPRGWNPETLAMLVTVAGAVGAGLGLLSVALKYRLGP
jgi:hypothetical protein